MRILLSVLLASLLILSFGIDDAHARRMGGGKSLGYQRSDVTQRADTPRQSSMAPATASPTQPIAKPAGRSWLGPLAGLAAGGLLGWLLFGHGFEGVGMMDILLILLVVGGIAWFVLRRKSGAPREVRPEPVVTRQGFEPVAAAPAATPAPAPRSVEPEPMARESTVSVYGRPLPALGQGGVAAPAYSADRPDWFNEATFIEGAKHHFRQLQSAWNRGDLASIKEYVTPELFSVLKEQHDELGGAEQHTDVVELESRLLGLANEGENVVASVLFSGLIKEERGWDAKPFREVWHVQRHRTREGADWYVAGIQQLDD